MPDSFPASNLQSSKESLKAETQNITNSFEELDAQVNSESGFSPKDAEGSETAPGEEALASQPSDTTSLHRRCMS